MIKQKNINLEEYEEVCPDCRGKAMGEEEYYFWKCTICNGTGRINRIDKIKYGMKNDKKRI